MTDTPSKEDFRKLIESINTAADQITSKLKAQSDVISKTSSKVEEINSALNSKKLSLESQMAKAVEEGNDVAFKALKANYDELQKIQSRISSISDTQIISDTDALRLENTLNSILSGINELGTKPGDLPSRTLRPEVQTPGASPVNWQQQGLVPSQVRITGGGKRRKTKKYRKRGGYVYKKSPTRKLVTKRRRKSNTKTKSKRH